MKCKICGRSLKSPQSIEAGYGPVCYRNFFGSSISVRIKKRTTSKQHDKTACDNTYCLIPGQMRLQEYLKVTGAI